MPTDPRTPVIVGVAQLTRRPEPERDLARADEPTELIAQALDAAAADAYGGSSGGRDLLESAQSLRVVAPLSWKYPDPAALVARRLGISPAEHGLTVIGGNGPQVVIDATASAIKRGDLDVALIAGAEAMYTRVSATRRSVWLAWTRQDEATPPPVMFGTDRTPVTEAERACGLDRPVHVYPLIETALRIARREGVAEHGERIARLWARLADVAAANPHAWSTGPLTAAAIAAPGPGNRMVALPYTKHMCANMQVDQGAALVVCSVEAARAAGIPEDRWVFPLAGAEAHDEWLLSHRPDLCSSPALYVAARACLAAAGLALDDVEVVDLYSCFPSAVQVAAAEIGLPLDDGARPLTVTGGLGFAGGPGNNYVTHAVASVVAALRRRPGAVGMVTGLGWYLTKHAVGLYGTNPPSGGFRRMDCQAAADAETAVRPWSEAAHTGAPLRGLRRAAGGASGPATIEAYTVVFRRDGTPEKAIVACLLPDGTRTWVNIDATAGQGAADDLARMAREPVEEAGITLEATGSASLR